MRRATAALVLAASLGLTACSSDGGADSGADSADDAAGQSSATPSSATPSDAAAGSASSSPSSGGGSGGGGGGDDIAAADIPGLALGATDFPAPYTFTELPPGALEKGGDAVGGALTGATYDPAECGQAASATSGADLSKSGVALGADQTTGASLVEVVSPATVTLPDFETLADTCSTFTFSIASPTALSGKASVKVLPAPDVAGADRVQSALTTVEVTIGGRSQTIATTVYVAELRGVVVIVTGTSGAGTAIDSDVLGRLLEAGVAKVAAA